MNICNACELLGLNERELAHELGISQNYLYMLKSGKRQISKAVGLKLEMMLKEKKLSLTDDNNNAVSQSDIQGDSVNVIGNTHSSVNIGAAPPPSDDLAVVPTEALTEHIEVVQANNELLQEIREDQEKELRLKREQGRQLSEVLEFVQGLDEMMQKRVREVIDERTRTIISATNHHIHTQAQVMITAIEGIINMMEAGMNNKDLFLKQLVTVRNQLEKMSDFKQ